MEFLFLNISPSDFFFFEELYDWYFSASWSFDENLIYQNYPLEGGHVFFFQKQNCDQKFHKTTELCNSSNRGRKEKKMVVINQNPSHESRKIIKLSDLMESVTW